MCATSCAPQPAPTALVARNVVITQEFLQAEIADLEAESQKAQTFIVQAKAAIDAYRMLIAKINEPEPENKDAR